MARRVHLNGIASSGRWPDPRRVPVRRMPIDVLRLVDPRHHLLMPPIETQSHSKIIHGFIVLAESIKDYSSIQVEFECIPFHINN
jgi:hypothetical protein